MDILDAYTLVETDSQTLINTIAEARIIAGHDEARIWFVRDGDGFECECDEEEKSCECEYETIWDVEGWRGQFVNCLGFFVTIEPRKVEHDDTIFTY